MSGLSVELLEEAEAPQLVDAPVHARDEGGERGGPGVERGLVARAHLGDEVLERRLDPASVLGELALASSSSASWPARPRPRRRRRTGTRTAWPTGAGWAAPTGRSAPGDVLHALEVIRRHAACCRSGSRGSSAKVVSGVISCWRLGVLRIDSSDSRLLFGDSARLGCLAGRHVGGAAARAWTATSSFWAILFSLSPALFVLPLRRRAGLLLALGGLLEVGPLGPRLFLDPVVLLGQELRVRDRARSPCRPRCRRSSCWSCPARASAGGGGCSSARLGRRRLSGGFSSGCTGGSTFIGQRLFRFGLGLARGLDGRQVVGQRRPGSTSSKRDVDFLGALRPLPGRPG